MRLLTRLLLAVLLLVSPVAAVAEGETDAFRTVIQSQLDAFQRDDEAAAFAQASPMIKGMFRTPENFMAMVIQGYPQVYRPQSCGLRHDDRLSGPTGANRLSARPGRRSGDRLLSDAAATGRHVEDQRRLPGAADQRLTLARTARRCGVHG